MSHRRGTTEISLSEDGSLLLKGEPATLPELTAGDGRVSVRRCKCSRKQTAL